MKPIHLKSGVYDVDPRLTYRQLNRQVYNESGMSFYKKNCDKPLSTREIINYINTNPTKIGIVYEDEDEEDFFEVGVKFLYLNKFFLQHDRYTGETNMFKTRLEDDEYVLKNRVDTCSQIQR